MKRKKKQKETRDTTRKALLGPESPRKQPSAFLSAYTLGQWPADPWDAGVELDG